MPVDTSIYSNIQPVQIRDPLEQASRLAQLQALQGRSRLETLQSQAAEQQLADAAAERQAAVSAAGDITKLPGAYLQAGAGKRAIEAESARIRASQEQAATAHTTAQTGEIKARALGLAAAGIARNPDSWKEALEEYEQKSGDKVNPRIVQAFEQATPAQRRELAIRTALGHKDSATVLETIFGKTTTQDSGVPGALPISTSVTYPGLSLKQPGQAGAAPKAPLDLAKVSPADLEAGYRYFSDGTLPPNMGRGVQGAAQGTRIREIAAQISQNLGVSPDEARANQLSFKGSGTALTQLLRREAGIGPNVRNFDFNADQVEQLSKKVDRTGIPVVNAWMNAGRRSVQGNPEISAFDTAIKTTVNEFAQIVGGTTAGATTQGEKEKAEKLLNAAQTPQQLEAVIHQMRIESQNRMKSFADQKSEVLRNMRGGKPAAPVNAAPVQVAPDVQKLLDKYAPALGAARG